MRILLTNDDGIEAPGLRALITRLESIRDAAGEPRHELWVVAPESERSAVSHAKTIKGPTTVRQIAPRRFSCSGTPVDCVLLAVLRIVEGSIDLVVSGVNRGPNLGYDIVYSGTCGAARQAAMSGIRGIAVSCASENDPLEYGAAVSFIAKNLDMLATACVPGCFLNINAPSSTSENLRGVWSPPGGARYRNMVERISATDGSMLYMLKELPPGHPHADGSDFAAVEKGSVALSIVNALPS
ncbi:MAG: 5'/3'-nucleotidase SurE [Rectinemataceae bacterium]